MTRQKPYRFPYEDYEAKAPKIWTQAEVEGMLKLCRLETRAAALEEARQIANAEARFGYAGTCHDIANRIKDAISIPSTHVVVERALLAQVREALEHAEMYSTTDEVLHVMAQLVAAQAEIDRLTKLVAGRPVNIE